MFEKGISETRLRRARWAVYVFFGLFAAAGLGYVVYSAMRGDVFHALIGAGVSAGSIALGMAMHWVVYLAAVVDANTGELADLRKRADAMEALVEQLSPMVDLGDLGYAAESTLVAADSGSDLFPRLVPDDDSDAVSQPQPADADQPADSSESAAPLDSEHLRAAFRDAVYASDFAGALAVGRQIAQLYPQSPMADQFNELRQALESRTNDGDSQVREDTS
ncbi:MAG: hypothetical protein V3W34_10595 [Phycisphaerae bacterium]